MPAMTTPVSMPSSPTSKKTAEPTTSRPIGARSLADILGEGQTLKAWLHPGKGARTEAFIILAEGLSPEDREFLAGAADLVVDPSDDLPGRLARLARENRQLKSLSLSDDLTGLYNRRFFSLQLEIEMARSRRTGQPCCLMMIDFDNFKDINDRLGHDEGDRFLTQVGGLIREKLRPTDFVCRYGGDEFAVIMPATCLPDGAGIAARLCGVLASTDPCLHARTRTRLPRTPCTTSIATSICCFISSTCEITPTVRPRCCRSISAFIAMSSDSGSRLPKPSSMNKVSSWTPPA